MIAAFGADGGALQMDISSTYIFPADRLRGTTPSTSWIRSICTCLRTSTPWTTGEEETAMTLYDEEAHGRSTLSASPLCEPVGDAVVGMASLLRSCLNCVRPSSTVDSHIENKDFTMNTRTSFSSTSTSFSYFHFLLQNSSFSYFRIFNVNEDHPSTSSDMRVARVTEANSHAESEDAIDVVTHVHGTQTRFRSASGSDIEFGFGEDRRGNSDTDTEADSPVQIPWLRPYNLISMLYF